MKKYKNRKTGEVLDKFDMLRQFMEEHNTDAAGVGWELFYDEVIQI